MKHILGAGVSLVALAFSASGVMAACGVDATGSVRILTNDFAALKVVNDAASTCAADGLTVTVNQTSEHKNKRIFSVAGLPRCPLHPFTPPKS